ncbi:DUF692 domain-containing protein [Nocardia vinacea]|uniref:DUF692 domain-containing protein n=1 Tax=Nocardia vinacea TaxID=96468 RepID=UPI0002DAC75A|nr:DUF692 domain-containing protein [Nocardia vinacea]
MSTTNGFSKQRLPRLGAGLGYRTAIHDNIMQSLDYIDWLEIIADQFMPLNNATRLRLAEFRRGSPCVSHSLELSLASIAPVPADYGQSVLDIAEFLAAPWFSDHLAFNRLGLINTGSFLPPFRDLSSVHRVANRVRSLQASAGRPFLIENVAGAIDPGGDLDEVDFLNEVAAQADCGILLDIANLIGRCMSLGWNVLDYLDRLDLDRVTQIHVAGGKWQEGHLRDTHDQPVSDDVWSLLAHVAARTTINAVLIERDANFPTDFGVLLAELSRARNILADPQGFVQPFTGVPAITTPHVDVASQQQLESTVERVVLAAGGDLDERRPPSTYLADGQWRELRRFGAEVLQKRRQLVDMAFPATLILLGPRSDQAALIKEFAMQHPRVRAFDEDVGFKIAEISRFSSFAAVMAEARQLSPAARVVISFEAALAAATLVELPGPASVDCPTDTCVVTDGHFHLCAAATIALARSVHLVSAEFNVAAVRAAVIARQAASPEDLDRLCVERAEPIELLVAPSSEGKPRMFRLGRQEATLLQSIPGTVHVDHGARAAMPKDDFGRSLLAAAFRARTIAITHSMNCDGQE